MSLGFPLSVSSATAGSADPGLAPAITPDLVRRVDEMGAQIARLQEQYQHIARGVGAAAEPESPGFAIFNSYIGVFVVAFLVSLLATPLMRRLAVANGVVDRPLEARKGHRMPVAYMGGVAVFLGMMAAILFSYTAEWHGLIGFHQTRHLASGLLPGGVPLSILLGMTVIMIVGLIDDVMKISPRIKIAGQLVAAAALAVEDVGVKLAAGILVPIARTLGIGTTRVNDFETILFHIPVPFVDGAVASVDVVYWVGTALIALFVLGACNASNLVDGLDGLLTGITAIAAAGLLLIALAMASADLGSFDGPRIVLCLALLGACMGFLPHNFNPATIFLGDAGSLLLGYCTIVIILSLGDAGFTHLVLAGLIVYAIPIIDTTLAIVRRKVSGKSISDADDQHLHHMLKRALGVKGAVLALYGIAGVFATIGYLLTEGRGRIIYVLALVFAAFIGVTAFKIARRKAIEDQTAAYEARRLSGRNGGHSRPLAAPAIPAPLPPASPEQPATLAGGKP